MNMNYMNILALIYKQVVAMKGAATQLKQQFKEINIDEVEDLQDEMMELMDILMIKMNYN